jgi:hypothetical protein
MLPGSTAKTNRFVERFDGTVLEEFFRPAMHAMLFESVVVLQVDLDAWLRHTTMSGRTWATATRFGGQGKPSTSLSDKEVKRTT